MKKITLLCLFLGLMTQAWAQVVVTGTVVDDLGPLTGATIVEKNTKKGTVTDLDGKFSVSFEDIENAVLKVSFIGYESQEITVKINAAESSTYDIGEIVLATNEIGLKEVEVIASVAIDRKTPVAVSTIKPEVIAEKLGSQEFPEVLKSTPGIYATRQGGGYGDARVNVRGFSSENVAVMINGIPVNDMENGRVYWSNWAGLSDVARTIQVQRGLGASKTAVPSVGGTINIITKTTDAEQGGYVIGGVGNNGFNKTGIMFSSGLSDKGWAFTFSATRTAGMGYVDATQFEGWSYFANISKQIGEHHQLSLNLVGTQQEHGQRTTQEKLDAYQNQPEGRQYNPDWGYKNGQVYNLRKNFYNKPKLFLNHYWDINSKLELATSAYASLGTGGGTGDYGDKDIVDYGRDSYGLLDYDKIVAINEAHAEQGKGSEAIMRASRNNHQWYGLLSVLTARPTDSWTFSGGVDLRYYRGEHYREVTDLLGGTFYMDNGVDVNQPEKVVRVGDKIAYHNDGLVRWGGLFAQAEYSKDALSAFLNVSGSNISYQRIDYFNYTPDKHATDWVSFNGGGIKGGANYNVNAYNNFFANVGYFERQPIFDAVFQNFQNDINAKAENEKITSIELGYGLRTKMFKLNANVYRTVWADRTFTDNYTGTGGEEFTANILGVNALHQGVEVDAVFNPTPKLTLTGMISLGDWTWQNDLKNVAILDDNQNVVDTINLYIAGLKVADAAQWTGALGINYAFDAGLKIGADVNYFDELYAQYDPIDRDNIEISGKQAYKLPAYGTVDLNASYKFQLGTLDAVFSGNVNNLLDTKYISEAQDQYDDANRQNWNGGVYLGVGRTWSTTLKILF